jgi:hypothetical protein
MLDRFRRWLRGVVAFHTSDLFGSISAAILGYMGHVIERNWP